MLNMDFDTVISMNSQQNHFLANNSFVQQKSTFCGEIYRRNETYFLPLVCMLVTYEYHTPGTTDVVNRAFFAMKIVKIRFYHRNR